MKFLFDHNLPPRLAKAVNELTTELGAHSVVALRDKFPPDTLDHKWISALSDEASWAVVTRDAIYKNPLNKEALRRAGLVVFCLEPAWSKQSFWSICRNLIDWWPSIVEFAGRFEGGAALYVPWRKGANARFKQVTIR